MEFMRILACILILTAAALYGQQSIPIIDGETLSGRKVSLPAATAAQTVLLIIGFTRASQTQTKDWSLRVRDRFPAWSIAVLEDVPRLLRGVVAHGIKSGIPKELHDRFLLVYRGEKQIKQMAGFDKPDDAYVLVLGSAGAILWSFHGAVTDAAVKQLGSYFTR